ncbi:MAG TPA: TadE/TadG family type IV pilus assembly protein [Allosphingosinicella sp.]|jgi:Flp pilus assembly pilin Flp
MPFKFKRDERGKLKRDERGMAAIEFAFALPAFMVMAVGIVQIGTFFFADAGLKTAVGAGARLAAIFPTPGEDAIKAAMTEAAFRTSGVTLAAPPTVTPCVENGEQCFDLAMSFKVPIDLIFINPGDITLNERRRVFLQTATPANAPLPATSSGTPASSGAPSSSGTPVDPTPTSSGTPVDPTPTSSSTGGSTTTSASSTGGTTTPSSSGNASSGNASSGNASSGNASSGNASSGNGNGSSGSTPPPPPTCTKKNGKC